MTIVQIIVPVSPKQLHQLPLCLLSIKENTPVDHVVNVVVGKTHMEEKVGEIVACARKIYNRTGLVITCADPEVGYNGAVMDVFRSSDFPYTAVLPASHQLCDKEWFGKMQLPHIRAPGCGMTFAPDGIEPGTIPPGPYSWRHVVNGKFFMLQRTVMGTARTAQLDLHGHDLETGIRDHLRTVATNAWIISSCRVQNQLFEPW